MSLKGKQILITCGPTWAKIDDVRVISNVSSGEMGHLFADAFVAAGASVVLLEGAVTHFWNNKKVKTIPFRFYEDIKKLLRKKLKENKFDCIVHSAAISDFIVENSSKTKINSNTQNVSLNLRPTQKIISKIKRWSPNSLLVGFKLEPKMSETKAKRETEKLFIDDLCSLVIANSIDCGKYAGYLVNPNQIEGKFNTRKSIVNRTVKTISRML